MREEIIISRGKIIIVNIVLPLLLMFLFGLIMIRTKPIVFFGIDWIIVIYTLFVFLIHEVLHGLGFKIIGKAEWKDIKFVFNKKNFAPYCICKDLILSKRQYIWIMLLPNIILSLLTLGIMVGSYNLIWAIMMGYVVGCGAGDYYMVVKAMKYPNGMKFQNHPSEAGFFIYK